MKFMNEKRTRKSPDIDKERRPPGGEKFRADIDKSADESYRKRITMRSSPGESSRDTKHGSHSDSKRIDSATRQKSARTDDHDADVTKSHRHDKDTRSEKIHGTHEVHRTGSARKSPSANEDNDHKSTGNRTRRDITKSQSQKSRPPTAKDDDAKITSRRQEPVRNEQRSKSTVDAVRSAEPWNVPEVSSASEDDGCAPADRRSESGSNGSAGRPVSSNGDRSSDDDDASDDHRAASSQQLQQWNNPDAIDELFARYDAIMRDPVQATAAAKYMYDLLLDELILGCAFDWHYADRTGLRRALDGQPVDAAQFAIRENTEADIFGMNYLKVSMECACPKCDRMVAASRFAPHLEKCMGMGRISSRVASRRLASRPDGGASTSYYVDDDVDDADDGDWTGEKRKKKSSGVRANGSKKNGKSAFG